MWVYSSLQYSTTFTFIINDILIYLANKNPCYHMQLDLSSTFDSLNHNILSIRLNQIRLHGQFHSYFMYFVSLGLLLRLNGVPK